MSAKLDGSKTITTTIWVKRGTMLFLYSSEFVLSNE